MDLTSASVEDVNIIGWGIRGEYRFSGDVPISAYLDYAGNWYEQVQESDHITQNTIVVGLRIFFGAGTLLDNDRSGVRFDQPRYEDWIGITGGRSRIGPDPPRVHLRWTEPEEEEMARGLLAVALAVIIAGLCTAAFAHHHTTPEADLETQVCPASDYGSCKDSCYSERLRCYDSKGDAITCDDSYRDCIESCENEC